MKTQRIIKLALILLGVWLLPGCQDDETETPVEATLKVVQPEGEFDWKGEAKEVMITTNQDAWLFSVEEGAEEWCVCTPRIDRLIVKPAPNYVREPRSAVVTITAGGRSESVTITQIAGEEVMLEPDVLLVNFVWQGDGDRKSVKIRTNQMGIKAVPNETWCHATMQGDTLIYVTADRNETTEERPAIIKLTAKSGITTNVRVTQEAKKAALGTEMIFDLPTDFSYSQVYDVWDGDVRIAEICNEYISKVSPTERVTVVYPVVKGVVDLKNGYLTLNGGQINWTKATDCYYAPGAELAPVTRLSVSAGVITASAAELTPAANKVAAVMKDADGNIYPVVKIARQFWMAENMRTEKESDGTPIGTAFRPFEAGGVQTPAAVVADDRVNPPDKKMRGLLYNWPAAIRVAPTGWHLPAAKEYEDMMAFLGGKDAAPAKIKKIADWFKHNDCGNITGFGAVPAGYAYHTGVVGVGACTEWANWWTSAEEDPNEEIDGKPGDKELRAYYMGVFYDMTGAGVPDYLKITSFEKDSGYSVRLIRD